MLKILEYVNAQDYSTLKVGGRFRYFTVITSTDELNYIYAIAKKDLKYKDVPIFILGGGSNIIFSDGIINVFALKIEIKGFEIIKETNEYIDIKIGAGENWDQIVEKTVNMNLMGLESLSAIPGTVGAGPVQNIGAYGSEVKNTILEVEVYDTNKGIITRISNKDCKFGYRDSIFKNEAKGKYIITAVIYRLLKCLEKSEVQPLGPVEIGPLIFSALNYPGVMKYFEDKGIKNPDLKQIREAVIEIRKGKLPNPKEVPNVGSFFKNPIISNDVVDKIKINFPNAKFFPVDNNLIKVPAGWLIENALLKGKNFGSVSVYDRNALVLVNAKNATCKDFIEARNQIIRIVKEKFDIVLEQEPEIL